MDDDVRRLRAQRYGGGGGGGRESEVSTAPGGETGPEDAASVLRQRHRTPYAGLGEDVPVKDEGDDSPGDIAFDAPPIERVRMPYTDTSKPAPEDLRPPPPPQPSRTSSPEDTTPLDDRQCRICLGGPADGDRLISPCRCRGTSRYVHLSCLNEWRRASRNNASFYRCDQCRYHYHFYRTSVARALSSAWALTSATAIAMCFGCFVMGFVVKLALWGLGSAMDTRSSFSFFGYGLGGWGGPFWYSPIDAGKDLVDAATLLVPTRPRTLKDVFTLDVYHFVQGFASLGLVGLVGAFGSRSLLGVRQLFGGGSTRRRRGGNGRGDSGDGVGFGEAAFILILLFGAAKVALATWSIIRDRINRKLTAMGDKILDVEPEAPVT
ncbi:hypothetical protein PYCC9005_005310 [Savitreella phatthalungensis]